MVSSPSSAERQTIAVTGASGIVGQFICRDLLNRGFRVRGLTRQAVPGVNQQDLQWITGEFTNPAALEALCDGADALVHCAFNHTPGRYRGGEGDDPGGFWRDNLGATSNLLQIARRLGIKRGVLMSSRAVFGNTPDAPSQVNDQHPTQPDTHYGALKVATESLVRSYSAAHPDLAITCLRPTGVYGLIEPVTASKWTDYAKRALAGLPIEDVRCATEVHGADVADAVLRLLTAPAERVRGKTFNCSDILISTREIATLLATRTGSQAKLPAEGSPPSNQMVCDGLLELGWQPGGRQRLASTLDELLSALQARTSAGS